MKHDFDNSLANAELKTALRSASAGIGTLLASLVQPIHKSVFQSTQQLLRATAPLASPVNQALAPTSESHSQSFFDSLPSLNSLNEQFIGVNTLVDLILRGDVGYRKEISELHDKIYNALDEFEENDAALLDDEGYLLRDSWFIRTVIQLVGIHQVDHRVRAAVITNKLLGYTKKREFAESLEEHFNKTPILSRRWRIIENALDAHRNRGYLLSVPALLAQVEGILADALVMKEIVYVDNGKVYSKNYRNGKPRELKGMYELANEVKKTELQENREFRMFANLLIGSLARNRNMILHGRNVDYGKANLSVKLILYILGLADEISRHADVRNFAKSTNA